MNMRVLCLGAGAIGGYFAGRLVESEAADVTFLVRPGRKAQLERDGLNVESPSGSFQVPVIARLGEEVREPADYILLTCKAYDLDAAIQSIRPAVGPATAVVPLLNGLSHMDRLNAEFGSERVLGGIAHIAITMLPDGTIKHLNNLQTITFGEQSGGSSSRVDALKAAFDKAKAVTAVAAPNVIQRMWEKLVFLSTLASVTTLMRANVGEIARAPGGTEFMLDMLRRSAGIAGAAGYPMPAEFMSLYGDMFVDTKNTTAASMLRDIERHGPVEADHIVGFMLDKAREHGLDDTLHRISFINLKAYEQRRAAERL
jgi:2-dehydropantoate 2-reductase